MNNNIFNQIDDRTLAFQRRNCITDNLIKRLQLYGSLQGHEGCVNCIEWNHSGTLLCSGSDDCNIIIWDPFKKKQKTQFHSHHTGNIFAVKFLELNHENLLISGAGDSKIILHDYFTHKHLSQCTCHKNRVKKLATSINEPNLVWSAGEDGIILQTDIRQNHTCKEEEVSNVLINLKNHCGSRVRFSSVACNQVRNEYIAVGANDQYIRLYDRRMIRLTNVYTQPSFGINEDNLPEACVKYFTSVSTKKKNVSSLCCTNLCFSNTGDELLANISSNNIYLYDIINTTRPKVFTSDINNLFSVLGKKEKNHLINDEDKKESDMELSLNFEESCSSKHDGEKKLKKVCKETKRHSSKKNKLTEKDKSKLLIESINLHKNPNLRIYKVKEKLPKHILSLYKNAVSYFKREKYINAIELINEAISIIPNSSRFFCLRANILMKRNSNNDLYCAIKDFHKSLSLDIKNKESHFKLSQCLYSLGYFENADKCLEHFSQLHFKDTRYKEFKELKKSIQNGMKNKPTEKKKKNRNYSDYYINPNISSASTSHTPELIDETFSDYSSDSPSLDADSINFYETESTNDELIVDFIENSDFSTGNFMPPFKKNLQSKKEFQWRSDCNDFKERYYGHCNIATDIMEANFLGSDNQFIIAGSDDGYFYIWDRKTTNIVNIVKADEFIVNCVQPHYNSLFIASSGLDNDIKLWTPTMNENLLEQDHTVRTLIRQKINSNLNKMTSKQKYKLMFLRVNRFSGDTSDSEEEENNYSRRVLNFRECLLS